MRTHPPCRSHSFIRKTSACLVPYCVENGELPKPGAAWWVPRILGLAKRAQLKVFEEENCSNPTRTVVSWGRFAGILNPVAGRVASATVSFAVPLIVSTCGDSNWDPREIIDKKPQVFHHQAPRDENKAGQRPMLEAVKQLWEEKNES